MAQFCQFCGVQLNPDATFCPSCGKRFAGPQGLATAAAPAAERVILDLNDIKVTSARFIVHGQTYAMSGITSVRLGVHAPSRKGPLIFIGLGLVVGFLSSFRSDALIFALVCGGIGVAWWILHKSTYFVVLTSASGETETVPSKNMGVVKPIVDAINEAIVHRG